MADLTALRELAVLMREVDASHARVGELELRLNPRLPQSSPVDIPPPDPADDERRTLETLLHSSGVDPEPFLRALRGRS